MKNLRPDLSFVNGVSGDTLPVTDRGLQYGDGLFETLLFLEGKLILETLHLDRLLRDAARLKMVIDAHALARELACLCEAITRGDSTVGVVKILATRASSGRGYATNASLGSNRLLQYFSGISYPVAHREGIRLALSDYRLSDIPVLAGIKHLNRLDQVLAHSAVQKPFYQEALVCNAHGDVLEGTISNVFVVKNGMLITPRLDKAGVQGVMRDYILATVAPELKLQIDVRTLSLDDVLAADEVFVCNSVFGVWPVTALNVKQYAMGKITRKIQCEVDKLGYPVIHT